MSSLQDFETKSRQFFLMNGTGKSPLFRGPDRFSSVLRIRISYYADPDPDPGSKKCPYGSGSGSGSGSQSGS